jgi:hypothetical protein
MFNKNFQISISSGNSKMGAVPSVSLPPVTTCRPGAPCAKGCYACKLCKRRKNVRNAYARNLDILNSDPESYFRQLDGALKMARYFRVHVSGDVPNADYFARLVAVVAANPHCKVLMFTKQYEIVNEYADHNEIPANFQILFSNWGEWKCENPHNFPTAEVVFKGQTPADSWKVCGGNCADCACRGVGCWELKHGETICGDRTACPVCSYNMQ